MDHQLDTLLNPLFIIEVLSESTQDYGRGRKFQSYRSLESVREYRTVARDAIHIERWSRLDTWILHKRQALSLNAASNLKLTSYALSNSAGLPVEIKLFDICERVEESLCHQRAD